MQSTEDALLSIVQSRRVRRWFWTIVLLLGLLICIRCSFIDVNEVPSGSMAPTIEPGEHILINKIAYDLKFPLTKFHLLKWGDPKVGDIVVFDSPNSGLRLVKRIVAVGGQHLAVSGDQISIDGVACDYLQIANTWMETLGDERHPVIIAALNAAAEPMGPTIESKAITLPPQTFFMMGDNRDQSSDSRAFGPVPRSAIIGHVIRIF